MDLFDLGAVSWWESQCFYHALARLNREALIVCYPASPYVCLGIHDDLEYEIDQEYCGQQGIPLLRRETGGGVVYLDDRQIFYQLVMSRDNPLLPLKREKFYRKFLQPAIKVYQEMNMPAELRHPADIVVNDCKCSGNAAGDIGKSVVYTGNILIDFDFDTMCRVLKVPTPSYRESLREAMRGNMTTISDCLDTTPGYDDISKILISHFTDMLGELAVKRPDQEMNELAGRIKEKLTGREWLQIPGRRQPKRSVKIAEGIYLHEHKNAAGESTAVLDNDRLQHRGARCITMI